MGIKRAPISSPQRLRLEELLAREAGAARSEPAVPRLSQVPKALASVPTVTQIRTFHVAGHLCPALAAPSCRPRTMGPGRSLSGQNSPPSKPITSRCGAPSNEALPLVVVIEGIGDEGETRLVCGPLVARTPDSGPTQPSGTTGREVCKGPANGVVRSGSSRSVAVAEVACHAGGRGFESRRSRKAPANQGLLLLHWAQSTAGFAPSRAYPARGSAWNRRTKPVIADNPRNAEARPRDRRSFAAGWGSSTCARTGEKLGWRSNSHGRGSCRKTGRVRASRPFASRSLTRSGTKRLEVVRPSGLTTQPLQVIDASGELLGTVRRQGRRTFVVHDPWGLPFGLIERRSGGGVDYALKDRSGRELGTISDYWHLAERTKSPRTDRSTRLKKALHEASRESTSSSSRIRTSTVSLVLSHSGRPQASISRFRPPSKTATTNLGGIARTLAHIWLSVRLEGLISARLPTRHLGLGRGRASRWLVEEAEVGPRSRSGRRHRIWQVGGYACARAARRHWAPRVRQSTPRRLGEIQPVTLKDDEVYEEPAIAWSV